MVERDPAENRYLECAVAGEASVIVSGDRHLSELGKCQGVQVGVANWFSASSQAREGYAGRYVR